jgi:tRNA-dihydrouridine synthase A
MMEWTDRYCRYFLRLISKRALLYTEMVTADAVLRGDRKRLLAFHPAEHPVALQIGGSDPQGLAEAARLGAESGYDEINLNVGCPSDRVQAGRFGACLMAEPELVADLIAAMGASAKVPVTVKCRIGIDDQDGEESLDRFIDAVARGGCRIFILHARKAWLEGRSRKEPRRAADRLRPRLSRRGGLLTIIVNGGIGSFAEAVSPRPYLDGVMLAAPLSGSPLAEVDQRLFGAEACVSRLEVPQLMGYAVGALPAASFNQMTRPSRPPTASAARGSAGCSPRWRISMARPRRAQGCARRAAGERRAVAAE